MPEPAASNIGGKVKNLPSFIVGILRANSQSLTEIFLFLEGGAGGSQPAGCQKENIPAHQKSLKSRR